MRIIAGKWRGARLLAPPDSQTRPMLDQVKEAVFNILGTRLAAPGQIPPCRVLDLFAGTGSLGLEALSRGAAFCTFVESHRAAAKKLSQNLDALHAAEQAEVRVADALKMSFKSLPAGPYDLVFIDPPYKLARRFRPGDPVNRIMAGLIAAQALDVQVTVVLRHPRQANDEQPAFEGYALSDQRTYAGMTLSFMTLSQAQPD